MSNYNLGKIYCIKSKNSKDIYIGSTCLTLERRFELHSYDFLYRNKNLTSSKIIFKQGDAYIELIENCPCKNKTELIQREGDLQRQMDCVNKQIAGRSKKEYYDEHKEHLGECMKKNYEKNKEKYIEKASKWRINNREKFNEHMKKARKKNKELRKKKFNCDCGGKYTYSHKSSHLKTKLHQVWLNLQE